LKADDGASISSGIVISVIVLGSVQLANATASPYDTRTFVPTGPPYIDSVCDMLGCYHNLQMTFTSNANETVTGIAYFVFRNPIGQTVYLDGTDLSSAASQSASATIPLTVPVAERNISIFIVSQGGVALSNPTVIRI